MDNATLDAQLHQLEGQLQHAQGEETRAQSAVQDMDSHAQTMQHKLAEMQQAEVQIEQASQHVQQAEATMQHMHAETMSLEQRAELDRSSIETDLRESQGHGEEAKHLAADLDRWLKDANSQLEHAREDENNLKVYEEQVTSAKGPLAQLGESEKASSADTGELDKLKPQAQHVQDDVDKHQKEAEKSIQQISQFEGDMDHDLRSLKDAEHQITSLVHEMESQEHELEHIRNGLQNKLNDLHSQVSTLHSEIQAAQARAAAAAHQGY